MTSPIAFELVGGWLAPELLGPWSGMYVVLLGPFYISIWPDVWREQRDFLR